MTDTVVIAGAGPGGLTLACELGLAGVSTVVLEPRTERPAASGGALLHARVVELLTQRGIADRFFTAQTPRWNRTHFGMFTIDLTGDLGDTEYDLLVPQWRTEQLLEQRAVELGVDVRRGHRVVAFEQDEDGVTVEVSSPAGTARLRCAYLVGCDGVASTVGRLGGFDYEVFAPPYYGILADVPEFAGNRDEFRAGLYPTGQFAALPLQPGKIRLMTVEFSAEGTPSSGPVTVDEIRASIHRITGVAPDVVEPSWADRYGSATQVARNYRDGRVFLAGDAAHAHPPSSGNGMVTTMYDALNLGWKLAAAVHGWAPPGLLDTYQDERQPVGRRACLRGHAQYVLMHPLPHVLPLREVLAGVLEFDNVKRYLAQYVTEVRYPIGYPGRSGAHPLLGSRFPDLEIATVDGPVRVCDLLHTGQGVLLTLGADPAAVPDLSTWADRVRLVRAGPAAGVDVATVLIRPDGFVAAVDQTGADREGLLLALKTWFG